ncbi:MAG: hypothetical protein ACYSUN_11725, partial [Planctomycetota bacterium]
MSQAMQTNHGHRSVDGVRGVLDLAVATLVVIASHMLLMGAMADSGTSLVQSGLGYSALSETMPHIAENLRRDWAAAEREGRMSAAQRAILDRKLKNNGELIERLGRELVTKQKSNAAVQLAACIGELVFAAGGLPHVREEAGVISILAPGALGAMSWLSDPVADLDDVKQTWNELQMKWHEPKDVFVRSQLGAELREVMDRFRGETGVAVF